MIATEMSVVAQFSKCKYRNFFSNNSNTSLFFCNKSHFITFLVVRRSD